MEKEVREKPNYLVQFANLSDPLADDPMLILKHFFMDSQLSDFRKQLWEWVRAALKSDCRLYDDHKERGYLLFLYERLIELAEAAYLLYKSANKEMKEAHKKLKRYNRIIHLTGEYRENPQLVFEDFFDDFHLKEVRQDLQTCLYATLAAENITYNNHRERGDLLLLHYRVLALGQAAILLTKEAREKESGKRNAI